MSATTGLSADQVVRQRAEFGENRLTPPKQVHPVLKFLMQFANFFSILLLGGGILCFVGYGLDQSDDTNLYLGIVLVTVVFITSTFSFIQESKSEKIMEGFKSLVPKRCAVLFLGFLKLATSVCIPRQCSTWCFCHSEVFGAFCMK